MDNLAEITLWGQRVGALVHQPQTGFSTFEYDPGWRDRGIEIAPIHMPLSPQKYQFRELATATFRGLPAVFADALPDDFGNAVIHAWLARQGRDASSFSPVERLLYTGQRGMGALGFLPALDRPHLTNDTVHLNQLVHLAQQVLNERTQLKQTLEQGRENPEAMSAILQVGTSAGGARAKAVVAINQDRTDIRSGQIDAPAGFEHYLLKLDGVEEHKQHSETFGDPQGFGRMEYAYYLMAKDAGLNMSHSELLVEGERAHFMTKRFDRGDESQSNGTNTNIKHHYVSLCAMDHADYKQPGHYSYERLLSVARQLRLPRTDAIELFKRMVFNVMARNHDDHTKNFGFLLKQHARWRLAPAFDIAYSYKPGSPWVNTHQMSLNGKRDHFTHKDLMAVASLISNFREAKDIIQHIKNTVSQWPIYAEQAGVFPALSAEVQTNLRIGKGFDW